MLRTWQCTLATPRRTAEVEAYDWMAAQQIAAELFGTRRVRDIYVVEVKP